MITAGVNQSDLNRITDKLNKLKMVLTEPNNPANPIYNYKFSVLMVYQDAIIRAMGSVIAIDYTDGKGPSGSGSYTKNPNESFSHNFHGDITISLSGLGMRHTLWRNLKPYTVMKKRKMGWRMTIWEASGDTEKAVLIHKGEFAGIDGSTHSEELRKARNTEYGDINNQHEWPKRALFTVANDIVMSQKEEIEKRIKNIILTYISWGS